MHMAQRSSLVRTPSAVTVMALVGQTAAQRPHRVQPSSVIGAVREAMPCL